MCVEFNKEDAPPVWAKIFFAAFIFLVIGWLWGEDCGFNRGYKNNFKSAASTNGQAFLSGYNVGASSGWYYGWNAGINAKKGNYYTPYSCSDGNSPCTSSGPGADQKIIDDYKKAYNRGYLTRK